MPRQGRKSRLSSARDLSRAPLMPAGQRRCRSTSSSYGDRFITERNPDASLMSFSPTKPTGSGSIESPSHVARIALVTSLPQGSHMLDLHRSTHSPSLNARPLATPLPTHPLQTRYHVPNAALPVKKGKVRHVKPERVLDAPLMRVDYEGCTRLITWSHLGQLIVGIDQTVYMWDPQTSKVSTIADPPPDGESYITALEWSRRLSKLAVLRSDGSLYVVDPSKGNTWQAIGARYVARSVQSMCCADGLLVVGREDGMVSFFDPRTPLVASSSTKAHSGGISILQTSADSRNIVTGGEDKTVKVWDRRSLGSANVEPYWSKRGLSVPVNALAWCPWKTDILAMDDGPDNSVLQCWNVDSSELVSSVETFSTIRTIQFPPLAKEIATTHGWPGNSIQVHRYPSMLKVATSTRAHHDPVACAAINPCGTILATGSEDQTIRMWRLWELPAKRTCHPSERDDIENTQILR